MAYEFHYTPTGTGAISGAEVLEQTEDAINDLGNTAISGVREALDKAEQAFTNSANAVDDAQTALNTANNAEGVAIQAQTDVGNLSGTVANIGNRVTTAEGNITNLQGRMITAEGNIGNLQGRMTTAEGNIGNLQTAVSTAQATANSAQQTATTARQQSYVFRYSSTALVASSTNSNTLLDNTDNLKVGDKVIDSNGVLFSITAIDTANSTFTVGSALVDLALDANVVHTSGDETVGGVKTFTNDISLKSLTAEYKVTGAGISVTYSDKNGLLLAQNKLGNYQNGISYNKFSIFAYDSNNQLIDRTLTYSSSSSTLATAYLRPDNDNIVSLGTSGNRWSKVYAMNYYYGNDNVEFSTKFVTTDTNQTITGNKTFSSNVNFYNSDSSANTPNLILQSSKIQLGDTTNSDNFGIIFNAGLSYVSRITAFKDLSGTQNLQLGVRTKDSSNNLIGSMIRLRLYTNGFSSFESDGDNLVSLGSSSNKFKDVQTYKVNGLEPSSLGMPDIDNKIDISSYITDLANANNEYTPTVNGWICVRSINANKISILDSVTNIGNTAISNTATYLTVMTPVVANRKVYITVMCTSLSHAYFIPCLGNV